MSHNASALGATSPIFRGCAAARHTSSGFRYFTAWRTCLMIPYSIHLVCPVAEHDLQSFAPFHADADARDLDGRIKVAQDHLVGGMELQRRRDQHQSRRCALQFPARKISATGELAALGVPLDAHPVIERL